ncbi:MAG: archaellin/type IV pilin N-terminal domain-containing protein [Haloferacaceae archaeon]
MFEKDSDRGQVGIGTLIVFIAMVLVAAIAAGVLINTAGFLQQQSQSTGQQASEEVSNSLTVVSETGLVDGGNNTVGKIKLLVKKSPGADPIDLSKTTFEYTQGTNRFAVEGAGTGITITDPSGGGISTLQVAKDRAVITITLAQNPGTQLSPGKEGELKIITASGATTTVVIEAPSPLSDKNDGEAVRV